MSALTNCVLVFRFALDIDIDAPKVRVPLKPSESIVNGSIFLLDFGHFTLHTKVSCSNQVLT